MTRAPFHLLEGEAYRQMGLAERGQACYFSNSYALGMAKGSGRQRLVLHLGNCEEVLTLALSDDRSSRYLASSGKDRGVCM